MVNIVVILLAIGAAYFLFKIRVLFEVGIFLWFLVTSHWIIAIITALLCLFLESAFAEWREEKRNEYIGKRRYEGRMDAVETSKQRRAGYEKAKQKDERF
ncbi:hypothetical protein [Furfurilactobacillus milii]|uniref:Uncharacterized protein n=1 Tax=Furfurilactobacillus milii TaxID=2888272 RepID=A0A6N9I3G9_9LACO|nr:hypothetical protein [Furfurilactobacillus milii]MYV17254.1 hypothetical protein [Furfurilactobacillus milii]